MATQLTQQNAPSWIAWLTDFENAKTQWLASWHALREREPWVAKNAPHLLAKHRALMDKYRREVVEIDKFNRFRHDLMQGMASIGVALKSVADFTGITSAVDWFKGTFGLQGLGLAPAVWLSFTLAAALGIVSTMQATTQAGRDQVTLVDAFKRAVDSGATAQEAADIVEKLKPTRAADGQFLGLPIKEALIAGVLIAIGPSVIRMISEARKS